MDWYPRALHSSIVRFSSCQILLLRTAFSIATMHSCILGCSSLYSFRKASPALSAALTVVGMRMARPISAAKRNRFIRLLSLPKVASNSDARLKGLIYAIGCGLPLAQWSDGFFRHVISKQIGRHFCRPTLLETT